MATANACATPPSRLNIKRAPPFATHIHIVLVVSFFDLGLCLCMQLCLKFLCMLHARLQRRAMHFCMQTLVFLCMLHARVRHGVMLFGKQAQGCSWCLNSLTVHSTTMSLLHKTRASSCRFPSVVVHLRWHLEAPSSFLRAWTEPGPEKTTLNVMYTEVLV